MGRYKTLVSSFVARMIAMLPQPAAGNLDSSSDSDLNTHEHREYRQQHRQLADDNEERAWAATRESLDNLR